MKSCEWHFKQRINNICETVLSKNYICFSSLCFTVFIKAGTDGTMAFLLWVFCLTSIVKRKQGLHLICASNQKLFSRHHVSHSAENQADLSVSTPAKTGEKRTFSVFLQIHAHRTQGNITCLPKHMRTHQTPAVYLLKLWSVEVHESFDMKA